MLRPLSIVTGLICLAAAGTAHGQVAAPSVGYIHVGAAFVEQADDATLFAGGSEVPGAGFRTKTQVAPAIEGGLSVYQGFSIAAGLVAPAETPNIAAGSLEGLGNLGDEKVGFATLTAQYHFIPGGNVSPYVGAGLGYMFVTDTDDGAVSDLDIDNAVGMALQAGMDVRVSGPWGVYVDAKKLFIDTDASGLLGGAPITAEAKVNPWIIQAGVGYRF